MKSQSPSGAFPTWQHRVVKTYTAADGTKITVEAGLHYLAGNSRPYFSVVGEVRCAQIDKRGRRYYRREPDAFGCCHEEILKAVAGTPGEGLWRDVIALHLSDDRGQPMHAVENACYHLGLDDKYSDKNDERAQSHLRMNDREFKDLKKGLASKGSVASRVQYVTDVCARLATTVWKAEAERGMEALRRLAGENEGPADDDLIRFYSGLG
jgi:hypothetical protein